MARLLLNFEVPDDLVSLLVDGEVFRRGGAIINKKAGKVIGWLRETSLVAVTADDAELQLGRYAAALGLTTSSCLPLGAVCSFGAQLIKRDTELTFELRDIDAQTVRRVRMLDTAFLTAWHAWRNSIAQHTDILDESTIIAWDCANVARDAWRAELVGNDQRLVQLDRAREAAKAAAQQLRSIVCDGLNAAAEALDSLSVLQRLRSHDILNRAVHGLRRLAIAAWLAVKLEAETRPIVGAVRAAIAWHRFLNDHYRRLMRIVFRSDHASLDRLLRLDPSCGMHPGLVEVAGHLAVFLDHTTRLEQDVDRIDGLALEFEVCSALGLRLHEYREMLAVQHAPPGAVLAIFSRSPGDVERTPSKNRRRH
jgi:hypothetical protein